MHLTAMTIKEEILSMESRRGQTLLTAGGILGALAASSCCILPVVLFSLGVSGAWIGNFTQLAPYQPYFIAATLLCLSAATGSSTAPRNAFALTAKLAPVRCRTG
jgi:mercuric ion transport protein